MCESIFVFMSYAYLYLFFFCFYILIFNYIPRFNAIRAYVISLFSFQSMMISWASHVMSQLTYNPKPGEKYMTSYFRYQLAPFMCQMGVKECRDAAWAQYQALRVDRTEYVHWTLNSILK
jgi:hypothetical protein